MKSSPQLFLLAPFLLHFCLSQDLNLPLNYENGDSELLVVDSISDTTLEEICLNSLSIIYVVEEDLTIDCREFKPEQEGRIVKREAQEDVEGSGSEEDADSKKEISEINYAETKETDSANSENGEQERKTTEAVEKPTTIHAEDAENQKPEVETTQPEVETTKPQRITTDSPKEENKAETTTRIEETTQPKIEAEAEAKTEDSVPIEKEETTQPKMEAEAEAEPEDSVPIEQEEITEDSVQREIEQNAETKTLDSVPTEIEDNKEDFFKAKEGGANPSGKSSIVKNGEESKIGESTTGTKTASTKDTTILVVLFVAVCVVGAAAFTYNFIKKRKLRQRPDVERGSIKQSIHNLNITNSQPEAKPLIDDKKDVEMVEMKKENGTAS